MGSEAGFYSLLALYVIFSLIHLFFCFIEKERWRRLSKGMCLPFLLGSVVFLDLNASWLFTGLLFGWIGDLLLLKKHKVYPFAFGVGAFLLNHLCYIAYMVIRLPSPFAWGKGLAAVGLLFPLLLYPLLHRYVHQKHLAAAVSFYASSLLVELVAASALAYFAGSFPSLLVVLGVLLFIASDAFLGLTLFRKDHRRRDFYIMLLYLSAQALIAIPLALL